MRSSLHSLSITFCFTTKLIALSSASAAVAPFLIAQFFAPLCSVILLEYTVRPLARQWIASAVQDCFCISPADLHFLPDYSHP